jgi:hypothetical protein
VRAHHSGGRTARRAARSVQAVAYFNKIAKLAGRLRGRPATSVVVLVFTKMGISPGYWETPLTNALKLRAVQTHYFFGVTRPFLQASVNSSLESLPSLLVSAELKFLTAD